MANRTDSTGKRRPPTARRMGGGTVVGERAPTAPTAKGSGRRRRERTKQRQQCHGVVIPALPPNANILLILLLRGIITPSISNLI